MEWRKGGSRIKWRVRRRLHGHRSEIVDDFVEGFRVEWEAARTWRVDEWVDGELGRGCERVDN